MLVSPWWSISTFLIFEFCTGFFKGKEVVTHQYFPEKLTRLFYLIRPYIFETRLLIRRHIFIATHRCTMKLLEWSLHLLKSHPLNGNNTFSTLSCIESNESKTVGMEATWRMPHETDNLKTCTVKARAYLTEFFEKTKYGFAFLNGTLSCSSNCCRDKGFWAIMCFMLISPNVVKEHLTVFACGRKVEYATHMLYEGLVLKNVSPLPYRTVTSYRFQSVEPNQDQGELVLEEQQLLNATSI